MSNFEQTNTSPQQNCIVIKSDESIRKLVESYSPTKSSESNKASSVNGGSKNGCHYPIVDHSAESVDVQKKYSSDSFTVENQNVHTKHFTRLGIHTEGLWKRNVMTDISVKINDRLFYGHKAVLTCFSQFFKKRLLTSTPPINKVELIGINSESFDCLLEYMYTGKLRISHQHIVDLYVAAKKLHVEEVLHKCLESIDIRKKGARHPIFAYSSAKKLGLQDYWLRAYQVIQEKFEEVTKTSDFLTLEIHEVCEILSTDIIGTFSELVVFLAALKWLNHQYPERQMHVIKVMKCVRFSLMSAEEILGCFNPPLFTEILESPEVFSMLLTSSLYILAKMEKQEKNFKAFAARPRNFLRKETTLRKWDKCMESFPCRSKSELDTAAVTIQTHFRGYRTRKELKWRRGAAVRIQAIYRGYSIRKMYSSFLGKGRRLRSKYASTDPFNPDPCLNILLSAKSKCKDVIALEWFSYPANVLPRVTGSIQMTETPVILATGGINPEKTYQIVTSTLLLRYNPQNTILEKCEKIPLPRNHHAMVVLEKCIYVIGGCDSRDIHVGVLVASNACFQYHLPTNTWKKLNYMNHCRLFHGATALNGLIYAVGGRDDNGKVLSSVETFDPKTNNWAELDPPLCCPRMTMGVVAHKGLLFVAGGMIQLSSKLYQTADVEVYNPEMNRWHFKISKLPSPCCFVTLVDTGTKLFAIGGASHSNSLQSSCDVCVYDNEVKTWKKTVSLPSPRHSVAAASVGEKVYVFGGLTTVRMRALNEILVLEPTCSKWKKAGSLPTPMVGLATVTVPQDEETLAKSQQLDSEEITKFIL